MKLKVYLLFIYLITLTALPSIRAMKLQFGTNKQICNSSKPLECEKGKLVMSLNFSPLQFINEITYTFKDSILYFDFRKETSFYESSFISFHQNSIWHPPKSLV